MDGVTLTSTSLEDTSLCYASSSAPVMCGTIVAVDAAPAAEEQDQQRKLWLPPKVLLRIAV